MQVKRLWLSGPLSVGLALGLLTLTTIPASATEGDSSVSDRVSNALVKAGAPATTAGKVSGTGYVRIETAKPSGSITVDGQSARLTLETSAKARSEQSGSDRAFGDVARDTDSVVRSDAGSVQIISIMRTRSAPKSQRYTLDLPVGVRVASAGGGFVLFDTDGGIVGMIEAPWAKDATGRSLPTRYTVDGNALVQTTDTTGAKFPVVADPKITFGRSVYLGLWGWEARAMATEIAAIGGAAVVVSCTLIGKIPFVFLRSIAAIACGAVALNLTDLFRLIYSVATSRVLADSLCYQLNIGNQGGDQFVIVGTENCS
jgi:hypothetical protein